VAAEESRSLVLRYFQEIVNKHDISPLREIISPRMLDHDFNEGMSPAPDHSHQHRRRMGDVFPDVHDDIEVIAVADDRMAVRVIGMGTHSDELYGVPATEK